MPQAGSDSPHLGEEEQRQAAANAPLSSSVVHEIVREQGEREIEREASSLLWSGLAAGLSMGFSFLVEAQIQAALPDASWRHLVASAGYTVGFLIVVLGRQQLFTESTLTAVLPVLTRRTLKSALSCLRLWGLVLAANLLGTWLFAAALAYGHPFRAEVLPSLLQIAREAVSEPFWPVLLKAVFAGWLIALMVWLLPSAGSARPLIILLMTYVVAVGRFSHVIAGSSEAAFAVLRHETQLRSYVLDFLVPTLVGNTAGGVLLVALLNHAPLAPELEKKGD